MSTKSYISRDAQFYPTPEHIGKQLLRHVNWKHVTAILEPSAGKGDLLRLVNGQSKIVECIELDPNLQAILRQIMFRVNSNRYDGERIEFKYFSVEFKKKGTIHLWFKNAELLKKFNIFGANKKGWLPNGYGKKGYDDMTVVQRGCQAPRITG